MTDLLINDKKIAQQSLKKKRRPISSSHYDVPGEALKSVSLLELKFIAAFFK